MGKYKFRLSDMMPNAWFYKLKDMSRTKNQSSTTTNTHSSAKKKLSSSASKPENKVQHSEPRQSYYYTIESINSDKHYNSPRIPRASDTRFPPNSPRRSSSSKRKTKRKTVYKPSPRHSKCSVSPDWGGSFQTSSPYTVWIEPEEHLQSRHHFPSSATESSTELDFLKCSSSEFESDDTFDGTHQHTSLNGLTSWSSSCNCRISSSTADIIIDVNEKESFTRKFDDSCTLTELDLPPIQTKPAKSKQNEASKVKENRPRDSLFSIKSIKEESIKTTRKEKAAAFTPAPRKSISQSTGVKVRANSPKLASKKFQGQARKGVSPSNKRSKSQKKTLSESFAVVKASIDPEKDFRESMKEMIVENDIRALKDLEDLLAAYLSLNSNEYHDLIIKAFEKIWFSMPEIHS